MVKGLSRDDIGVRYYATRTPVDGLISTNASIVKLTRAAGLYSILRIFIVDTQAFENSVDTIHSVSPSLVEVMPALIEPVITELKSRVNVPLITGGHGLLPSPCGQRHLRRSYGRFNQPACPLERKEGPMNTLSNIRAFLLDMDGTFYLSNRLYPDSLPFMYTLSSLGIDYLFLTNNSITQRRLLCAKACASRFCRAPGKNPDLGRGHGPLPGRRKALRRLYVAGTPSLEQELRGYGFILTDENPD